jgi:hypothetical protein
VTEAEAKAAEAWVEAERVVVATVAEVKEEEATEVEAQEAAAAGGGVWGGEGGGEDGGGAGGGGEGGGGTGGSGEGGGEATEDEVEIQYRDTVSRKMEGPRKAEKGEKSTSWCRCASADRWAHRLLWTLLHV